MVVGQSQRIKDDRLESPIRYLLLISGLSTFDLVYLVVGILIFGLPVLSAEFKSSIYFEILPISYGVGHIGRVGSVFVTMCVRGLIELT